MWNKINLYQFQEIDRINANESLSELDKLLYSTCIVFNKTEYQLDKLKGKKAVRLIGKVKKIFSSEFKPKVKKRLGYYRANYDVSSFSFGQYIELSFFLNNGDISKAHYVLATITHLPFCENNAANHRKKSEYFLKQPIPNVVGAIELISKNLVSFNKEYQTLFGIDKEVSGDVQEDVFNKRYGWIYCASQIAKYERITLEQAFNLPVRQAFNDLAYLKAKTKYEAEQIKNNKNGG
jgi:hypothetical protein